MTQKVIILGAARSGTKYLRDILALSPNAAKVPYDISYIWRYGSEHHPDDLLPRDMLTERKVRFIQKQVHRLARVDPLSDMVVLEKTVGNTLRPGFVDGVFPDARFIHLVRDGRAVTESAMRQWQEPLDRGRLLDKLKGVPLQNLGYVAWFGFNVVKGRFSGRGGGRVWGPRYRGIDADVAAGRPLVEICAKQWRASAEGALAGLCDIPAERQMTVRYDDFVSGTGPLRELAQFCGLSDIDALCAEHAKRVDPGADDKWKQRLSAEEQSQMFEVIGPMLDALGYANERQSA